MSARKHYICSFLSGGKQHFVIWFTNDEDGLLVQGPGKLLWFKSEERALSYIEAHQLKPGNESLVHYNFDPLENWTHCATRDRIDCREFLNAWNIFLDVGSSIGGDAQLLATDAEARDVYNKLFYGNNLPVITPPGEWYVPNWELEEVAILSRLMALGVRLIADGLSGPPSE